MTNRNDLIADLLMGAALADRELADRELTTVRTLLCQAIGQSSLPPELEQRLQAFDASTFDKVATAKAIGLTSPAEKRNLIDLIMKVHESDETWDLDEDLYLREVAKALGIAKEHVAELTVGPVSIEAIAAALALRKPPPLPKS